MKRIYQAVSILLLGIILFISISFTGSVGPTYIFQEENSISSETSILVGAPIELKNTDTGIYSEEVFRYVAREFRILEINSAENFCIELNDYDEYDSLMEGNILFFDGTAFGVDYNVPLCVKRIDDKENVKELELSIPSIYDVYDNLSFTGNVSAEKMNFVPAEGIEISIDVSPILLASNINTMSEGNKKSFNINIIDGVSSKIILDIRGVDYAFELGEGKIKKTELLIDYDIQTEVSITKKYSKSIPLGTLSIPLIDGFSFDYVFSLEVLASGSVTLNVGVSGKTGFVYPERNGSYFVSDCTNTLSVDIKDEVKAGVRLTTGLYWCKDAFDSVKKIINRINPKVEYKETKPIICESIEIGADSDIVSSTRENGLSCLDMEAWIYFDLSVGKNCYFEDLVTLINDVSFLDYPIKETLCQTFNILGKNDQTCYRKGHYEDVGRGYQLVETCTYRKENNNGLINEVPYENKEIENNNTDVLDLGHMLTNDGIIMFKTNSYGVDYVGNFNLEGNTVSYAVIKTSDWDSVPVGKQIKIPSIYGVIEAKKISDDIARIDDEYELVFDRNGEMYYGDHIGTVKMEGVTYLYYNANLYGEPLKVVMEENITISINAPVHFYPIFSNKYYTYFQNKEECERVLNHYIVYNKSLGGDGGITEVYQVYHE